MFFVCPDDLSIATVYSPDSYGDGKHSLFYRGRKGYLMLPNGFCSAEGLYSNNTQKEAVRYCLVYFDGKPEYSTTLHYDLNLPMNWLFNPVAITLERQKYFRMPETDINIYNNKKCGNCENNKTCWSYRDLGEKAYSSHNEKCDEWLPWTCDRIFSVEHFIHTLLEKER